MCVCVYTLDDQTSECYHLKSMNREDVYSGFFSFVMVYFNSTGGTVRRFVDVGATKFEAKSA